MKNGRKRLIVAIILVLFASKTAFCNQFSADNTDFALKIYEKLQKTEENLVFSPCSLSVALSMTYAGARGETADQMAQTLCFSMPQDDVPPAFAQLQEHLDDIQKSGDVQLSIANSLWPQEGYPFRETYLQLIQTYYGEEITPVDYVKATEKARKTINRWVENKTHDKIENLISKRDISPLTVLVLVNAVYFKGNWAEKFDKKRTFDGVFHVNNQKTVKTPLMFAKNEYLYAENDDMQIVSLPYKGNELSMVVLLPKMGENGQKTLKISAENLEKWQNALKKQRIELIFPKFHFLWGTKSIKKVLNELGMILPFSSVRADFSGMNAGADIIHISDVLHKAFIEVNEEGTEAAAATAVVMWRKAIERLPVFRVDHPFIFIIKDNQTGSILFMGKVNNPAE